jgi:hypothetical protein
MATQEHLDLLTPRSRVKEVAWLCRSHACFPQAIYPPVGVQLGTDEGGDNGIDLHPTSGRPGPETVTASHGVCVLLSATNDPTADVSPDTLKCTGEAE